MLEPDVVSRTLRFLESESRWAEYKVDPVLWARERAGVTLWGAQADIARSVVANKDVVVKAGHGVGKSFLAAVLIAWWVDTRYPNVFVASTAPSGAQISAIVWREVRRLYRAVAELHPERPLPGRITSLNEWKTDDGTILGFGRKPPDEKTDDAFQGLHDAGGVLAVGDEAVGLREDLIDALGNITSNASSRRFLICNPTNPSSYVAKLFKERPDNWTFHTISVFDNPNFTGEDVPDSVRAGLSDETYVDSKRAEYGEGSPRWVSRVLGEFAYDTEASLFTDAELSRGFDTEILPSGGRPVLGVDVARFGKDSSVIYVNDGGHIRLYSSWDKASGTETAARIHRAALDTGAIEVRIDGTGLGGPIVDQVVGLCDGAYRVIEIKGAGASPDREQWHNWRAWSYDAVRHDMLAGRIDIDVEDAKLSGELGDIQYRFSPRGGLLIESKEDMRRRGLKSPDFADAFIYAALSESQVMPVDEAVVEFDSLYPTESFTWDML